MKQIDWLFFDVGSTLVNEEKAYQDRIEQAIADTNISYAAFYQTMNHYFKENKKGDAEAMNYYGLKRPSWRSDLEVLYPDCKQVLKTLHQHYKIGIIANQLPNLLARLRNFGIDSYIDLIISSADVGLAKPNLAIFKLALQQANCLAEHAVMIGDRLDNDILPAKQLGMRTIWIRQGFSRLTHITNPAETPDWAIDNLTEILEILG